MDDVNLKIKKLTEKAQSGKLNAEDMLFVLKKIESLLISLNIKIENL